MSLLFNVILTKVRISSRKRSRIKSGTTVNL